MLTPIGVTQTEQNINKGGSMTKRTSPLFHTLLKAIASPFVAFKHKVNHLFAPNLEQLEPWPGQPLALEPIEPVKDKFTPRKNTKWVLAETSDSNDENKNVVLVEVEYFPDTNVTDLSKQPRKHANYTIEGDDPNLRITHYPSNRLH